MLDTCEKYERFVSNPRLQGATGSDGARRELHKQLSIMIFGRNFESLDEDTRERISDFACLAVTGLDSRQLGEIATQKGEDW